MKNIKTLILEDAAFWDAQMNEIKLNQWAEALGGLPTEEIRRAQVHFRNQDGRARMPFPADIRTYLGANQDISSEMKAREAAARIVGAVSKYGWNNAAAARLFIGPEGWQVIERQGGWAYICEHLGTEINPSAFQAQLRDQLEGVFRYGLATLERSIGALPSQNRRGDLTSIGDVVKLIPPGGDAS